MQELLLIHTPQHLEDLKELVDLAAKPETLEEAKLKCISKYEGSSWSYLVFRSALSNQKFLVATFATFVATKSLLSLQFREICYEKSI
jgi:hypothetical protein